MELHVFGIAGLPEVTAGDDVAGLITAAGPALLDGDVVVVTSKIVSKTEGRVVPGEDREAAIDAETARLVATRGATRIVETRHGFVMAAAGVDASNVPAGTVALLPLDPDDSARRIRGGLRERQGVDVAVLVTDTMGRPWRNGLVDVTLGAAGLDVLVDLRGQEDSAGHRLDATITAVADELAAAADLVKGKLDGVPVAVVRGWPVRPPTPDPGARPLVRPAAEDMFRLGTTEAKRAALLDRRDVIDLTDRPVEPGALQRALAAAAAAPDPTSSAPWRMVTVIERLPAMLDALGRAEPGGKLSRTSAPLLIVPCLITEDAAEAGQVLAIATVGAAVENLLVGLAAEGLGAMWSALSDPGTDAVRRVLELPSGWLPVGVVCAGQAASGSATAEPSRQPGLFIGR
jgi:coenzyme F420-0:L-glutamate ligase/coenzyme F420-1:gamma-L-glutamate ligase